MKGQYMEAPVRTCINCFQIKHYSYCNYDCQRVKKNLEIENMSMRALKDCLENNFNLKISTSQISNYQKDIKRALNKGD